MEMKVDYPGLLREPLPSGAIRLRVRVEGNPRRRIRLHVDEKHDGFNEAYRAARAGIELPPPETIEASKSIRGSIGWLVDKHMADMEKMVEAGQVSPLTLKKRKGLMRRLKARCGDYSLAMPQTEVVAIRDEMAATPAIADSMVEAISSMYREACERGRCDVNPAIGVARIDRSKGGAVPWTVENLRQFRECHTPGTTPHLALTLFMFTACRISDAVTLGRAREFERAGVRGIGWQPQKKGSAYVEIPMLPPLFRATRAGTVQGATYLLNHKGLPFKSPDSLGQMFRRWCDSAGLEGRSSHGIRKAAGHLLAQEGCSQYQIMTIHGHTQAQTSEIYTKGIERWQMAADAMKKLERMDW